MNRTLLTVFILLFCTSLSFGHSDTLTISLNDTTQLTLIQETFKPSEHTIVFWDSTQQAVTSIDQKPVFGTDATMPVTELTFAELKVNGQAIGLETTGMYDAWKKGDTSVAYSVQKVLGNPLMIRCLFSYGAGTYLVEWTIIEDKSYRTLITSDMRILDSLDF